MHNRRGDLPTCLTTLGDHIRKRRLNLGLSQREAAHIIGVEQCSVYNWEKRGMNPAQRVQSAIIDFLGYDPNRDVASSDASDLPGCCAMSTDRWELHEAFAPAVNQRVGIIRENFTDPATARRLITERLQTMDLSDTRESKENTYFANMQEGFKSAVPGMYVIVKRTSE